jgi:hypothetical protein
MSALTLPAETDTPSIIDADAVLSGTIANKLLEPVSWRGPQIIQGLSRIQEQQLPQSSSLNTG